MRPSVIAGSLLGALTLHNGEEALTFGRYRDRAAERIGAILGTPVAVPTTTTFWAMLGAVTIVGLAVAFWAGTEPFTTGKRRALMVFAGILLANVFVPHVPAAFALGGYAPGVVTGVAVNLPVALVCLRHLAKAAARPR